MVRIFLLAAFLAATTFSYAQIQFGLKAGANLAHIKDRIDDPTPFEVDELSYRTKLKPQLGAWLNFPLTPKIGLQPELLWTQKALHAEENNPDDGHINFDYFSMPLMLTFKIQNWQFEIGPEVSFLMDQEFRNFDSSPLTESPFIEEHTFEFAANIGLRYVFDSWSVGLRGSRDLTDFQSFQITDLNGEPAGTLRGFHESLMVWIGCQLF